MSSKQYNPEGRRRMAFWLSDEEHEKLHRIADANGLTMSAQIASSPRDTGDRAMPPRR